MPWRFLSVGFGKSPVTDDVNEANLFGIFDSQQTDLLVSVEAGAAELTLAVSFLHDAASKLNIQHKTTINFLIL
jgi:hypothetical protein